MVEHLAYTEFDATIQRAEERERDRVKCEMELERMRQWLRGN